MFGRLVAISSFAADGLPATRYPLSATRRFVWTTLIPVCHDPTSLRVTKSPHRLSW